MSQDTLPMQLQPESKAEYLRATPLMHAGRVFLVLGGPVVPPYEALPQYDPLDDLEKGCLPVMGAEEVATPPESPTITSTTEVSAPPAAKVVSARVVFANFGWYLGKAVFLVGTGAAIAAFCSVLGSIIGAACVVGWLPPYKNFSVLAGTLACIVGGAVIGAAIGLLTFLAMCVRRARMSQEERKLQNELAAKKAAQGGFLHGDDYKKFNEEPMEFPNMVLCVALCSAPGMVLGMAIIPWLAAVAQETGFGYGNAAFLGAWGIIVPFIPSIVGAVLGTLFSLDPVGGWNAGSDFWPCLGQAVHEIYGNRR
ncbi:hypothetical protein PYCCODRAFT_1431440 [Trametes coccinea BRFM310]|uniref:Uncharacterized protein n=1 Tax=Trametes coccinea (strain BRFM310) TaxID=1353009 RepID=A0A1Y2IZ79_TRAC3|nr:hypothetical protein PYCCODRAFT_1431440 [Trametes coccinea BRFM310]